MSPTDLKALQAVASAAVSIAAIICFFRFCTSPNGHDTGAADCAAACQKTGVAMHSYKGSGGLESPDQCVCESKP